MVLTKHDVRVQSANGYFTNQLNSLADLRRTFVNPDQPTHPELFAYRTEAVVSD